jgi:N-methylhydantoinase A/oxoprolinase/acetone carboxylase beta subunit
VWEFPPNEANPDPLEGQAKYMARRSLASGSQIEGPAIISEKDATTYIPTGWKAQVTENGYLRIKKDGQS